MIVGALAKTQARARHGRLIRLIKTEHGLIEPGGNPVDWFKMRANGALDCMATRIGTDSICYVTAELEHYYRCLHWGLRRSIIHNGIQPLSKNTFDRPTDLDPRFFHLGIVGRVTRVKGISSAIRAFRSRSVPERVWLNIIGTGPDEDSLRRLSADLGVQHRVRFLGFKPNVHEYLAHLDALLMPSLHEGLPYTLLEAMSLGLPIIASRVGGLAEVLRDGHTACLVPAGDVELLSVAIAELVSSPERAKTMGLNAASEQRSVYTLHTMGEAYWRRYEAAARQSEEKRNVQ
jgi:glycosyltransferase involved in cell wall biosynthesis